MAALDEIDCRDYYAEGSYVTADIETGVLYNRSGRRLLALSDDFITGLLVALDNECGEKARQVHYRCGRKWGSMFGQGLLAEWSEFYQKPANEFPYAFFQGLIISEFARNGWGLLKINPNTLDSGLLSIELDGSVMLVADREGDAKRDDRLTAGILAGMFSSFFGQEFECLFLQPASEDATQSQFLITARSRFEASQIDICFAQLGHAEAISKLTNS